MDVHLFDEFANVFYAAERVAFQFLHGLLHGFRRLFFPGEKPHHELGIRVMVERLVAGQVARAAVGAFPHEEGTVLDPGFEFRIKGDIDTLTDVYLRLFVALTAACGHHR